MIQKGAIGDESNLENKKLLQISWKRAVRNSDFFSYTNQQD
jgi:hypothetical protein